MCNADKLIVMPEHATLAPPICRLAGEVLLIGRRVTQKGVLDSYPNRTGHGIARRAVHINSINSERFKGSMPPCIDHMELLAWMQRADFSEHIQRFKLHGNPLNSPHFDAPNTKFAPTGYRRAPNIISHHYKQQLSAKASIIPKARPIRFR